MAPCRIARARSDADGCRPVRRTRDRSAAWSRPRTRRHHRSRATPPPGADGSSRRLTPPPLANVLSGNRTTRMDPNPVLGPPLTDPPMGTQTTTPTHPRRGRPHHPNRTPPPPTTTPQLAPPQSHHHRLDRPAHHLNTVNHHAPGHRTPHPTTQDNEEPATQRRKTRTPTPQPHQTQPHMKDPGSGRENTDAHECSFVVHKDPPRCPIP